VADDLAASLCGLQVAIQEEFANDSQKPSSECDKVPYENFTFSLSTYG